MPRNTEIKVFKNGIYGFYLVGKFNSITRASEFINISGSILAKHINGIKVNNKLSETYKFEFLKNVELEESHTHKQIQKKEKYSKRMKLHYMKNYAKSYKRCLINQLLEYAVVKSGDTIENIELRLWTYNYLILHKVLKEFESENSKIYNFKDFNLFDQYAK